MAVKEANDLRSDETLKMTIDCWPPHWPLPDTLYILLLVSIMVLTGTIGGTVAAIWDGEEKRSKREHQIVGTVAALLVPLVLQTISSDLPQSGNAEPLKLLPFAGFCLLAASFAERFIATISSTAFNMLKADTDKKTQETFELASVRSRAIALSSLAIEAIGEGEYAAALDKAEEAIRVDKDYGGGYRNKAAALKRQGHLEEAVSVVQEGLAHVPKDPLLNYNLACYTTLLGGDIRDVLAALKLAISASPQLASTAQGDEDFKEIRGNSAFLALVQPKAGVDEPKEASP